MIRGFHLADFLTLGNAACGVGGVFLAMLYMASQSAAHFLWAAALARYNVTAETLSEGGDKVKYFEGTPIPTSVVITGILAFACWQGRIGDDLWGGAWAIGPWTLHPLALVFALSGTLMISKTLRIPKL